MKFIKAWALVRENEIPENNDEPKFLCVFKTEKQAIQAMMFKEFIKKIEIKILD